MTITVRERASGTQRGGGGEEEDGRMDEAACRGGAVETDGRTDGQTDRQTDRDEEREIQTE